MPFAIGRLFGGCRAHARTHVTDSTIVTTRLVGMPRIRLALAQINPTLGDFSGNSDRIVSFARAAADAGADIVVFPEMAVSGYPIEDLATRPEFLRRCRETVNHLAQRLDTEDLGHLPVLVGFPDGPFSPLPAVGVNAPTAIAKNSAAILHGGQVAAETVKHHLPNYGVFDEFRNFISEDSLLVARVAGADLAVVICEDLWHDSGPVSRVSEAGASALIVINASPFERDKDDVRLPLVQRRATQHKVPVAYVNAVGGQDDLVFDGDSVVVSAEGTVVSRAPQFREHLLVLDLDCPQKTPTASTTTPGVHRALISEATAATRPNVSALVTTPPSDEQQIWEALVLGLHDYVEKNHFPSIILGLSGGIDSSVVAAISVDALGADRCFGVSMPSRYSSSHSRSDADDLAERLGMHYQVEPIIDLVSPFETQLGLSGVAAENIQARARGMILMALSNQHGHLVLTTGNKSELAVGYSTIYGDAVGGFNPIKDVPKTLVWGLARWRNAYARAQGLTPPIPENAITKPPSAELRPDQTDQDSLPPYDVLDAILDAYIDQRLDIPEIISRGFDRALVERIVGLVDRAEWKRRQAAIGPKISGMAFGRDRRLPITFVHERS